MNLMSAPVRAIAAPVGLYAHVRSNHARSLLLFGGFLLAFHLMSMAALSLPLFIMDAEHGPISGIVGYLTRYVLPLTVLGAAMFGVRYWWHVSAVRKDTGFHYVDCTDEPRLVRIIEPLVIAAGLRPPFVAVIEDRALNAFAVGVRDSHMVVVVTRGLIEGLDDEELEAVLAHELMHIRNRDTRLMAAANAFLGNLSLLRTQVTNDEKLEQLQSVIGLIMLPGLVPLLLAIGFMGQLAHRIGFFSRAAIGSAREFIADAEAVRLTHNPAALASALSKVSAHDRIAGFAESHDAMLIAGAVEGPAATHPSMAQRIAALIQTTGPAMAYAPARRDTRTSEQRSRSGFGQALGASLMKEVAEARRPSLGALFRLTRDPDRNAFGLRPKGARLMWIGAVGSVILWGGLFLATGRTVAMSSLQTMAGLARTAITCQVGGMAEVAGFSALPAMCGSAEMEKLSDTLKWDGRNEEAAQRAQFRIDHRCFPFSLPIMEHQARPRIDRNSRLTWDLAWYQEWADRKIPGIEVPPPAGTSAADSFIDYLDMRVRIASFGRYYLGKERFPAVQVLFDDPRHRKALALFQLNMKKPAFAAHFRSTSAHPDSVELLAAMPDATSCSLRRQELGLP
jgi:Zn-dependent protease with chaperone function